jgi:hypothetical protein
VAGARLSPEEWEDIAILAGGGGTVESHVDRILEAFIERSDIKKSRLSSALLNEYRYDIFCIWDSQLKWLTKGVRTVNGRRPGGTRISLRSR